MQKPTIKKKFNRAVKKTDGFKRVIEKMNYY